MARIVRKPRRPEPPFEGEWRTLWSLVHSDPDHWLNRRVGLNRVSVTSPEFRSSVVHMSYQAVLVSGSFVERLSYRNPPIRDAWAIEELQALVAEELAKEAGKLAAGPEAPPSLRKPGPAPGLGLTIEKVRRAISKWQGSWPPSL